MENGADVCCHVWGLRVIIGYTLMWGKMALVFYKLYWVHLAHTCLNLPETQGECDALLPFCFWWIILFPIQLLTYYFGTNKKCLDENHYTVWCFQIWEPCAARTPHFLMCRDVRKWSRIFTYNSDFLWMFSILITG